MTAPDEPTIPYIARCFPESTPVWMAAAAAFLGHGAPDVVEPIRYLDIGCGNGISALSVAASLPHAEVWGIDIDAGHIDFATRLARQAGLTNAHFERCSFADFLSRTNGEIAPFDFIAAHGVLSWIGEPRRAELYRIFGRYLAPQGVAYISYNLATGWSGVPPVRYLMRQIAARFPETAPEALSAPLDMVDRLHAAGASIFAQHPVLHGRLRSLRTSDPRYVAHEYLRPDWYLAMFGEVAAEMSTVGLHHLGEAEFADNLPRLSLTSEAAALLAGIDDNAVRESVRDLLSAREYRADLFVRDRAKHAPREVPIAWAGAEPTYPMYFTAAAGHIEADRAVMEPCRDLLRTGPKLPSESLSALGPEQRQQTVASLIRGRWAAPAYPQLPSDAARAACLRLNRSLIPEIERGFVHRQLVSPVLGTSVDCSPEEIEAVETGSATPPSILRELQIL